MYPRVLALVLLGFAVCSPAQSPRQDGPDPSPAATSAQEAQLKATYAARERELRILDLERENRLQELELKAARAEDARNDVLARHQRLGLFVAIGSAAALAVLALLLVLLLRTQRRHARQMRELAFHDHLTGIENRRGFFARMEALLGATDVAGQPPHVLMIVDFDHFKRINDAGGHPFGDVVLRAGVDCLRAQVDGNGTLARLGGEEFAVLCPRLGAEAGLRLAEQLRTSVLGLRFPETLGDAGISISVGVALCDGRRNHDAEGWMRAADDALYRAKAHGRNRVVASTMAR